MKKFFAAALIVLCAIPAFAYVSQNTDGSVVAYGNWGDKDCQRYRAVIDKEGGFTLEVGGNGVFIDKGRTVMNGETVKASRIVCDNLHVATVIMKDAGYVSYRFTPNDIMIKFGSTSPNYMEYVFTPESTTYRTEDLRFYNKAVPLDGVNRVAYFLDENTNLLCANVANRPKDGKLENFFPCGGYGHSDFNLIFRDNTPEEADLYNRLTLSPEDYNPDINLMSPCEWRVFQRKTKSEGPVTVAGKTFPGADKVAVRVWDKSYDSGWKEISYDKITGAFNDKITAEAGGWYAFEIKVLKGGKTYSKKINRVVVGEVFVGAGQSNSTCCGGAQMRCETRRGACFDGKIWYPCNDPLLGAHDQMDAGSYYPAFCDLMYKKYGVPVAVVLTGQGGSSIDEWVPGGEPHPLHHPELGCHYDWMMSRMRSLGPGGFRAVLWHQGERDLRCDVNQKAEAMTLVVRSAQRDAGFSFPFIAAKASYNDLKTQSDDAIRAVYQKLWDNGTVLPGPDTDKIGPEYRNAGGNDAHFTEAGLRLHGKMWFDAVSKYLDRVL